MCLYIIQNQKKSLILTDQDCLAMIRGKHHLNKIRLDRQFLSNLQESLNINHATTKLYNMISFLHFTIQFLKIPVCSLWWVWAWLGLFTSILSVTAPEIQIITRCDINWNVISYLYADAEVLKYCTNKIFKKTNIKLVIKCNF